MIGPKRRKETAAPPVRGDFVDKPEPTLPIPELNLPPLAWRVAAASWVGLMRRNNQDSAFTSARLVGVADGMGGEAAGDLASMVAARQLWLADETLRAGASAEGPTGTPAGDGQPDAGVPTGGRHATPAQVLAAAVKAADSDIAALVMRDVELSGMGTTICAAALDGQQLSFVHIGDSRAYRWRGGRLTQLTHDHSFVQQLIDQGQLTEAEARLHPKRSLVLRIVNGTPLSRPDQFVDDAQVGDRYLLCSDGLCGYVSNSVIVSALRRPDLDDAVDAMLRATTDAGAPDNVTIVLLDIVAGPPGQNPPPKLWGAADTMAPPTSEPSDPGIIEQLNAWGAGLDGAAEPYEPVPVTFQPVAPPPPPRRRRRRLVALLVVLALLVVAGFGGRAWLQAQYFIGDNNGQVAIFRGVPYHIGGWYLSSIVETSRVQVADLPVYYADQVRQWGIKPASQDAARQTLAELSAKADICVAARMDPAHAPPDAGCP